MDPSRPEGQDPQNWPTEAASPGSWSAPSGGGYGGGQGGGQSEGYPGSQPPGGYPGSQPNYPGGAPQEYPGSQPGYPGSQPTYPGAQPGYPSGGYPGGQQQPPYGGAPTGGYPVGGYPATPWAQPGGQPPKKKRGLMIGLIAGGVVVVVGAVVGIIVLTSSVSPTTMALKAGQAIAPARGLGLKGTLDGENGSFNVTKAGTVEGTYTDSGNTVSRITISGATYLKAPAAFWSGHGVGSDESQQADGKWAKANSSQVNMDFGPFSPSAISATLEHVGSKPDVVHTTYNGAKVIKLTKGGVTYDVTSSSPYKLVHMAGTNDSVDYSFDVTALDAGTIAPVFSTLHSDVSSLAGAPDPNAIGLPDGKIQFASNCQGASSCTVNAKMTVTDTGTTNLLVKMVADFSATEDGTPFGTCSDTVTTTSGQTVDPSCTLGVDLVNWVNGHKGSFTTWADPHFTIMVNSSSDISTLQSELTTEQNG